jgi:hypothetical protein
MRTAAPIVVCECLHTQDWHRTADESCTHEVRLSEAVAQELFRATGRRRAWGVCGCKAWSPMRFTDGAEGVSHPESAAEPELPPPPAPTDVPDREGG